MSGQTNQLARTGGGSFRTRAQDENFPVAVRLLPRSHRGDLLALYRYARRVDDTGDEAVGDRLRLLDGLESQLDEVFAGGLPSDPAVAGLRPTIRNHGLSREPFAGLIEANRRDQYVTRYQTFDQLLDYCALSANPVGELVLGVFDVATTRHRYYSDRVCSALQVLEHCQDVVEDHAAGRVYLPADDMALFGVTEDELGGAAATRRLRALIALQVQRAVRMLDEGRELLRTVRGPARVAIAGYLGGGIATAEALAQARYDVVTRTPRPNRTTMIRESARLLTGAMR